MSAKSKEKQLFLVKTNLSIYPIFYVIGDNILDATDKAKSMTEYFGHEKSVKSVVIIETPLLEIDKDSI